MQTVRTNTNINASSQYTNFNFNSLCVFNGTILGAGDAGLFKSCCGDDDDSTDISAYFVTPKTNFGTLNKKRERYFFVWYEANGDLVVELTGDDKTTIGPYTIDTESSEGQQRRRAKIGALLFCSASHKISNVNGSDFAIDAIEVHHNTKEYGGK